MPQQKNETVGFVIEGIPPSLNHAYGITTRGGKVRRFPSQKLKEWRELVAYTTTPQRIKSAKLYGVEILFYYKKYYKNGNLKKKDVFNMEKYCTDEVIKKLETYDGLKIDDSQLDEGHVYRCDSPVEKTEVSFYAMV